MRISPPLSVDARDASTLRAWIETGPPGSAAVRRAHIVLLSAAGFGPAAIAEDLSCSKQTVITWRERYRSDGVAGLRDAPRSGRPTTVDPAVVIARTLEGPPEVLGAARWSTRLLATELGISNVAVANVWRSWGVKPGVAGRVRLATEPALEATVTAVAGVYLHPPFRLLALVVGDGDGAADPVVPVAERPVVGARLGDIDAALPVAGGSPVQAEAFLAGLPGAAGLAAVGPQQQLAVLAAAPGGAHAEWVGMRAGAMLHHVPAELSWARLVHVAGMLAGARARGRASVLALRDAVAAHPVGEAFAWLPELLPRACNRGDGP